MSEWLSVLAVFWALWLFDGFRLAPRRLFTWVARGLGRYGGRMSYSRLSLPGFSPWSWRILVPDVPVSFSPAGISNHVVGGMGRPVEKSPCPHVWRWAEIHEVGVARGWLFVNGVQFCPDTRHVSAPELWRLVKTEPRQRERELSALLDVWLRPAALRRRARILVGRTVVAATLNTVSLTAFVLLTVYVGCDVASRIPLAWSEGLAGVLPILLLALLVLHVAAVVCAVRALRRLKPAVQEKRKANLFSALLLPPQALRLRALLAEGFFPPRHPLTVVMACGDHAAKRRHGFHVLADLKWPLPANDNVPAGRLEIHDWFRAEMQTRVLRILAADGLSAETILAPPEADAPASCSYCPRCHDQFVAGQTVCPHGVELKPLPRIAR
jgi:hypothetical protein